MCFCVFCGQAGFWGLGNSGFRCSPCDCDIGGAHSPMYVSAFNIFSLNLFLYKLMSKITEQDLMMKVWSVLYRLNSLSYHGNRNCLKASCETIKT